MWVAATRGAAGNGCAESPGQFCCKCLEKERASGPGPGLVCVCSPGRWLSVSPSPGVFSGFCSQISDSVSSGFAPFLYVLSQNVEIKSCSATMGNGGPWWSPKQPSGEAPPTGWSDLAWELHWASWKKNPKPLLFGCSKKRSDASSGPGRAVPALSSPAKPPPSPAVWLLPHSAAGQVFKEVLSRCLRVGVSTQRCPRRDHRDIAER